MPALKQLFKQSLKKHKDTDTSRLSFDDYVLKLEQELPGYFADWQDPDYTGQMALEPIAKVVVEIDASGYVYTSLYNEKEACMVSEAASPDLYDWGLQELYEEAPSLVTIFLALCYETVLPVVCRTEEFLRLPRSGKVVFGVSEHSGWECEEVYVYTGERHEIDYGNIRLKQLRQAANCYTEPGTVEHKFMQHLSTVDVQKCSEELFPVFEEFLDWLVRQNPGPLEAITIAWSSDFSKEASMGGYNKQAYRWPGSFNCYKWFSAERPEDLDDDDIAKIRHCISNKIAEIACLAAERIVELEVFRSIPKEDNFIMEVMNRTAGASPMFYPFNANEDDYF